MRKKIEYDERIKELYALGLTARRIAATIGTTHRLVSRRFLEFGLKPRTLSEARKTHSGPNAGKQFPEWVKEKMRGPKPGKKFTEERRKLASERMKVNAVRGAKHWAWRGGKARRCQHSTNSYEYKAWRKSVFARDNHTCQLCGVRGGSLVADHIKPWVLYPELRLDVSNGRTLCDPCHRKTDTYGIKLLKTADYISKTS